MAIQEHGFYLNALQMVRLIAIRFTSKPLHDVATWGIRP